MLNRRHDALAALDPYEFEQVVADYYRNDGYKVEHCGGRGRFDGGIDLKMYRGGEYVIVQCKRENAYQVTHNVGHELLGVLLTEKADWAIVVNTGEFTRHAWESAGKEPRLELIDGTRLREMLPEYAVPMPEPKPEPADHLDRYILTAPTNARESAHEPMVPRQTGRHSNTPRVSPPRALDIRGGRRRSVRRGHRADGGRVIVALAVLAGMLAWQCSREPMKSRTLSSRSSAAAPVAPVSAATSEASRLSTSPGAEGEVPVSAPPTMETVSRAGRPAARSPEESRRRAEQAMQVLAPHTPEFVPLPGASARNGDGE